MFKMILLWLSVCMCVFIHGCTDHSKNSGTYNTTSNQVEYSLDVIQWMNTPFSWDTQGVEKESMDISTDIWLDDDILQGTVLKFDVSYPLSANEQIAQYALELCDALVQHEYFETNTDAASDIAPKRATHFSDGIWCIEFMRNLPGVPYGGVAFEAIVSESDGHVIYFYQYS